MNLQTKNWNFGLLLATVLMLGLSACSKNQTDTKTGWAFNDPEWGGYEKSQYVEQDTGPGLVLIEGGTFVMGNTNQDVMFEYDNLPRRVTVSSFYMDETEVSNVNYRLYVEWLGRIYGEIYPEFVQAAIPDTLAWREELAYNEPYVENYFRHPAYNDYPVVGVTWEQANEYCQWRSDRVNEARLIEKGYLEYDTEQAGEDHFTTRSYTLGHYEGVTPAGGGKKDMSTDGNESRRVRYEDGILLPDYRLPTEAEWEYAALAQKGTMPQEGEERYTDRRIYPWNGNTVRQQKHGRTQGDMQANFKRGRGDYMGLAGALNDNAEITAPVRSYQPNDFGLYNMGGNVSEWVLDVYRPLSSQDVEDFNPFRGNVFTTLELDEENRTQRDSLGRIKYREYTEDEIGNRDNYRRSNVIDYRDGDELSGVEYDEEMTLISDKSRVVKGGSWADPAYYLSPGTRRFRDQDQSSATIGFRCAMIRVGSPDGK